VWSVAVWADEAGMVRVGRHWAYRWLMQYVYSPPQTTSLAPVTPGDCVGGGVGGVGPVDGAGVTALQTTLRVAHPVLLPYAPMLSWTVDAAV
jgi:hypothetical protein